MSHNPDTIVQLQAPAEAVDDVVSSSAHRSDRAHASGGQVIALDSFRSLDRIPRAKTGVVTVQGRQDPPDLEPEPKQGERAVPGVPGMTAITYAGGRQSWFFRYDEPNADRRKKKHRPKRKRKRERIFIGHAGQMPFDKAVALVCRYRQDVAEGRNPKDSQLTFTGFVHGPYLQWGMVHKPASIRDDITRADLYYAETLCPMALGDIERSHVDSALEHMRSMPRAVKGGKASVNGQNRIAMVPRSVFRVAVDLGFISANPASHVRNVRVDPPSPRALEDQELRLLGAALESADFWLRSLVKLQVLTGMRVSEARHLQHDDVDRVNGVLHIRNPKSGVPETVPLAGALPLIDKLQALCRPDNPHLLHGDRSDGLPMSDRRRAWNKLLADAGIDHAGYHLLRKSWASQAMANPSMDLLTVSRILRHRSIRTTEVHYVATPRDRLRKASVEVGARIAAHLSAEADPS